MQTILIVDDEYTIAETLSEILAFEGFQTRAAPNGRAGLASVEEVRPDLILLDYMMPVMDGLKMLAELKREPRFASIPVILITAAPPRSSPPGAPRWDALLRKPFEVDVLVKTVREVLSRR